MACGHLDSAKVLEQAGPTIGGATMSETVSIRKSTILIVCGATILVLAILLIKVYGTGGQAPTIVENDKSSNGTLIQDKERVPIDPRSPLAEFLDRGQYHSIILVNAAGRVKWASADGEEVPICGQATSEAKDFRGLCGLKTVSIDKITQITLVNITKNPPCTLGNVDGALGLVHSTTGPPGKWKKGQWDCHDASSGSHDG